MTRVLIGFRDWKVEAVLGSWSEVVSLTGLVQGR